MREVKLFLKQVAYGFNGPVISILGLKQLIIWFFLYYKLWPVLYSRVELQFLELLWIKDIFVNLVESRVVLEIPSNLD